MSNVVTQWFASSFEKLHPQLQNLHQQGGRLVGEVDVQIGSGLISKRIAKKLGLPESSGVYPFEVEISHENNQLHWSRTFGNSHKMKSIFEPFGQFPIGYWRESTGAVVMDLGVEIIDGGWYWQQRSVRVKGISLPLFLFPKSNAFKTVENGKYRFSVEVSLPVIGKVIAYKGLLDIDKTDNK